VFGLLAILFFLSGASALIYQVVWLRMLSLVFGVTVYAASAVLTSFMSGLALGSWGGGKLADRLRSPLRAFALLELGIAVTALAVPIALDEVGALYSFLHARAPDDLARLTLARVVCSGVILLIPTTLMGASLPVLARYVRVRGEAIAGRVGALYAMNTAGGIAGTESAWCRRFVSPRPSTWPLDCVRSFSISVDAPNRSCQWFRYSPNH
jgi:spermidine synthase